MKVRTAAIAMAFSLLGAGVAAQENPNDFHARHNADSVYNVDRAQHASTQQPPRPTGYWETTWGAIAPSPISGVLGTAVGASSKAEAERSALSDCQRKGGRSCKVNLAYHNQCAVMIVGDRYLSSFSNATLDEAQGRGLAECQNGYGKCRVYYSACTEPIFHRY